MKCNYKTVSAQNQKTDVCNHLGSRWLDLLSELMEMYASDGEDIWETTLTANHGLDMRLRGIGVDIKAWMAEIPVRDRFGDSWRGQRDRGQHDFRANWIETMEKKLIVYWAVLLLWLNEHHGFGAIRLKRLFDAVRRDYVQFAEKYLMCKKSLDCELTVIIERKVQIAKAMLGEVEEKKPFISVEEFMKNHKKIAPTA